MELKKDIQQIVEKTKKERTKGLNETIKQCSIELYSVSDSYDCQSVIQNLKTYAEQKSASYVIAYHDKDIFIENTFDSAKKLIGKKGEPKKSHYHCLMQFPSRININDIAKYLGIEDRWILRLKKDRDFDNMIVYTTHENYTDKTNYDYHDFDTNISEYVEFLVEKNRDRLAKSEQNIIGDFISVVSQLDHKITYPMLYQILYGLDYNVEDIRYFYQQIKDIMIEHNLKCVEELNNTEVAEKKYMEFKIRDKKSLENAEKAVDTFGVCRIDDKYVLTNAQIKLKGENKK